VLGERQFQLLLDGKPFSWPFLLAAVQFPSSMWIFCAIMAFLWTLLATGWLTV
jgi:hypothetical protein